MPVDDPAPPSGALWEKVESYRPYLKAVAQKVLGPNRRLRAREDASDVVQGKSGPEQ